MTFDLTEPVDEFFIEIVNYAEVANIVNDPNFKYPEMLVSIHFLLNTKSSAVD